MNGVSAVLDHRFYGNNDAKYTLMLDTRTIIGEESGSGGEEDALLAMAQIPLKRSQFIVQI